MKGKYIIILILTIAAMICTDLQAQVSTPDRHSTVSEDAWLSCTPTSNPNSTRGTSHWIRYDLGYNYPISTIDIWNFNHPDSSSNGIQKAMIDISSNGVTWTTYGEVTIPRGSGSSFYSGAKTVANLGFNQARYVLITAVSNYGGSCFGLSEVRFNLTNTALPVAFSEEGLDCGGVSSTLKWKSNGESDIKDYSILASTDAVDWTTVSTTQAKGSGHYKVSIPSNYTYYKVKANDISGKTFYSDIVLYDCNTESNNMKLVPNPVVANTTLQLDPAMSQIALSARLVDITGRVISQRALTAQSVSTNWDLSNLSPGTYFLEVDTKAKKEVLKVVKI